MRFSTRMSPHEAIEHIVAVLSEIEDCVLFVTCVDPDGYVADSDCYLPKSGNLEDLTMEFLFQFPIEAGCPQLLLASRCYGEVPVQTKANLDFTRKLLETSKEFGIEIVDHYLVGSSGRMSLAETTDLWN